MISANGLMHLGYTPEVDFTLRDDSDGKGVYVESWKSTDAQPTEEAITTADSQWDTAYDAQAYARLRKVEYAKLNQFEMQFDDQRDSTTTWVDAVNAIKAKYPKPE